MKFIGHTGDTYDDISEDDSGEAHDDVFLLKFSSEDGGFQYNPWPASLREGFLADTHVCIFSWLGKREEGYRRAENVTESAVRGKEV